MWMSTRAHANICLGMKRSTRTKPEGDSEVSNVTKLTAETGRRASDEVGPEVETDVTSCRSALQQSFWTSSMKL